MHFELRANVSLSSLNVAWEVKYVILDKEWGEGKRVGVVKSQLLLCVCQSGINNLLLET